MIRALVRYLTTRVVTTVVRLVGFGLLYNAYSLYASGADLWTVTPLAAIGGGLIVFREWIFLRSRLRRLGWQRGRPWYRPS